MVIEAAALASASVVCAGGACNAVRERRRRWAIRDAMFTPCRSLLQDPVQRSARDGYPHLEGSWHGRSIRLSLIPDTLTPRRLPQLWLLISAVVSSRTGPLVFTARPRGEDYVSASTAAALGHLDVPAWLPHDFSVKGPARVLRDVVGLEPVLGPAFGDPLLKEIALTPGRLGLLYRLAEGQRGAHLLLRQAVFDAAVPPALLQRLLTTIGGIDAAVAGSATP